MRVKLITAVLALVAIALATISIAGLAFLRSYLLGQADTQLTSIASQNGIPKDVQYYLDNHRSRPYTLAAPLA
ncbi:MAG: hypothetical protein ACRDNZ_18700, partial [Streptosporangiaceae bacterium]